MQRPRARFRDAQFLRLVNAVFYVFWQDERDVSRKALLEDISRLEKQRREAEERASKLDNDAASLRKELAQALTLAREEESERER